MSTDTLSEVLRGVRLTGAVFFSVECAGPWVAEAPRACDVAPFIFPSADHVIEYHVLIAGSCWGGLIDEAPVRMNAGDVIVFPQGDAHVMSSASGSRAAPDVAGHQLPPGTQLPIKLHLGEGGGERAEVICGFFGCDARPYNPLLSTLPRVLHVRASDGDGGMLEQIVRLALAESIGRRSGSECVLARLSELLFIEIVRRYVAMLPPDQRSWLAGLKDELVGRALAELHDTPGQDWTLDRLAHKLHVSRSVLAERFTHYVGIPPIQYLTQWRMQLAATHLTNTTKSLAEIADQVGYGSEAAFSRAFKRLSGVAPAQWRQGIRARSAAP